VREIHVFRNHGENAEGSKVDGVLDWVVYNAVKHN